MCEVRNKNVEVCIYIETRAENGNCVQSKHKEEQTSQQLTPILRQLVNVFAFYFALYTSHWHSDFMCISRHLPLFPGEFHVVKSTWTVLSGTKTSERRPHRDVQDPDRQGKYRLHTIFHTGTYSSQHDCDCTSREAASDSDRSTSVREQSTTGTVFLSQSWTLHPSTHSRTGLTSTEQIWVFKASTLPAH